MITYYNRTHMTAVPTRPAAGYEPLRRGQRLTGALLYTLGEDGGLSCSGTCTC